MLLYGKDRFKLGLLTAMLLSYTFFLEDAPRPSWRMRKAHTFMIYNTYSLYIYIYLLYIYIYYMGVAPSTF